MRKSWKETKIPAKLNKIPSNNVIAQMLNESEEIEEKAE
jgi:hypothetical protein